MFTHPQPPTCALRRKQIIDAGPGAPLRWAGSLSRQPGRALPDAQVAAAADHRRARQPPDWAGCAGVAEDSDQIGGPFLYTLNILFDHSQFEIHKRAQILSAQKAAGSFAVEVGKQIEEIGWILDEVGNSRFVSVIPMVWVFGRDRHQAREMAARAKRLWEASRCPGWCRRKLPQSDPAHR
ncbi:MAG: hypothetical protein LKM31_11085 [Sphingobium sp.]|nr:hypothetical protein [Sphingobium sp.]